MRFFFIFTFLHNDHEFSNGNIRVEAPEALRTKRGLQNVVLYCM